MTRPAIPAAIGAFACAAVLIRCTGMVPVCVFFCILGVAVLLTAAFFFFRRKEKAKRVVMILLAALSGAALLCGRFLLWSAHRDRLADALADGDMTYRFTAVGLPVATGYGWSLDADASTEAGSVRTRLYLYGEEAGALTPGTSFFCRARLDLTDLTGSRGRTRAAHGIEATATGKELRVISPGTVTLKTLPMYLRRDVIERCDALFGDQAPLMKGLLLGDKEDFTDEFQDDAADVGISHIFAVSGMHLAFLAAAFSAVGQRRRGTCIAAMIASLLFAAMAGFPASVLRATVMEWGTLLATVLRRERNTLNWLGLALLVMLLLNPCAAADLGLQLSFLSVLGITVLGVPLQQLLHEQVERLPARVQPWVMRPVGTLTMTVSAQVFTLPVVCATFGRFSLVAIPANLLLLWVVELLFLAGWALVLASVVWMAPILTAAAPVRWLCGAVAAIVQWLADIPHATVGTDGVWLMLWVAAACVMGLWMLRFPTLRKALTLTAVSLLLLLGARWMDRYETLRTFDTAVLDVGYGQCVVCTAGGQTLVIDCGSTGTSFGRLNDYLRSRNLGAADAVILTANAPHHANGLSRVVSSAERFLWSPRNGNFDVTDPLVDAAEQAGAQVDEVDWEYGFFLGPMEITVVVPPETRSGLRGAAAVAVTCGGRTTAVLGDLSGRALAWLESDARFTCADTLVCARHGADSEGMAEFLVQSRAEYVIISSTDSGGADPAIRCTGRDGTVRVRFPLDAY